jgi:enoyl-CoA hydratase
MDLNAGLGRRDLFISTVLLTATLPLRRASAAPDSAVEATLAETRKDASPKLTVERRGQVALLGINRPYIQNRVDPETFHALGRAYYDYDRDPSLRAAILFGHGDHFSRGIDVDAFTALARTGEPLLTDNDVIDPLAKRKPWLTKPLIVAVHGDTWNMADELFLAADIRVAAANTNFGQDENTHGRFPGGGSTVRFVHEAGWGNAMRHMLTGDHWTAQDAYRMGTVQDVVDTPQTALARAIEIANNVAACGPLGIKATLESAHLAIEGEAAAALSQLDAQYGALFHTKDFQEGRQAEALGRAPVYRGK